MVSFIILFDLFYILVKFILCLREYFVNQTFNIVNIFRCLTWYLIFVYLKLLFRFIGWIRRVRFIWLHWYYNCVYIGKCHKDLLLQLSQSVGFSSTGPPELPNISNIGLWQNAKIYWFWANLIILSILTCINPYTNTGKSQEYTQLLTIFNLS